MVLTKFTEMIGTLPVKTNQASRNIVSVGIGLPIN
jgi:hypothetical protein